MVKKAQHAALVFVVAVLMLPFRGQSQEKAAANENSIVHRFAIWGTLDSELRKIDFYFGFTNGFFFAPSSEKAKVTFSDCLEENIQTAQAVAMIDKYYREHPERWNVPAAQGIIEALTVKDGPCPSINPLAK